MEALKLNIWTFVLLAVVPGAILMLAFFFALIPGLAAGNGSDTVAGIGLVFVFAIALLALITALVFAPAMVQTQIANVKGQRSSLVKLSTRQSHTCFDSLVLACLQV